MALVAERMIGSQNDMGVAWTGVPRACETPKRSWPSEAGWSAEGNGLGGLYSHGDAFCVATGPGAARPRSCSFWNLRNHAVHNYGHAEYAASTGGDAALGLSDAL